jgi:hypothetical protein
VAKYMTDPRCGKVSRANDQDGHCTRCHRDFAGEEAFTRHQRMIEGASGPPYSVCLDPATATVKLGGRLLFVERARPGTTDGHAWALNPSPGRAASRAKHLSATGRPTQIQK